MEKITSKNNELVKKVRKLFTSRKARVENNRFVLEGARLCFDALNSDYKIEYLFLTESACDKYQSKCADLQNGAAKAYLISDDVAKKLSDTENTQGVFAVCEIPENDFKVEIGKKYIALDCLQDPANLGAVARTAEALGINGAICFNCCDMFNPKALRASMGSLLRLPIIVSSNLCADIEKAKEKGFAVYAAVPDSSAKDITTVNFPDSSIMIIGNEGNGISKEVQDAASCLVTINMRGRAESLNASVAGAIAMWEMLRSD